MEFTNLLIHLPARERGNVISKAQGPAHEKSLDGGQAVDAAQCRAAQDHQRQNVVAEDALEAIHGAQHQHILTAAGTLVTPQRPKTTDIPSPRDGLIQ